MEENKKPEQEAAPDVTPKAASASTGPGNLDSDEKLFAALGYLAFLFVLSLIVKPKSEFCKFHARQSMVLFLVSILVIFIILPLIPILGSILTLALFALYILALYRAYLGEMWRIPVVYGFSQKINLESFYKKAGASAVSMSSLKEKMGDVTSKVSEGMKNLAEEHGKSEGAAPEAPVAEEKPAVPDVPAGETKPAEETAPPAKEEHHAEKHHAETPEQVESK